MPQASVSEARSGRQESSLFEAGICVSAVLARARGGVQETLDSATGRGLPLLTRGKPGITSTGGSGATLRLPDYS
jgi:hypothetical protein